MKTVREIALDVLVRIEKQSGFSHLLISNAIKKERMDYRDEALLTEIVYGTIDRKLTLDFYLEDVLKKQKKIDDWVMILLRLSVYQMAFLDKIPPFAIIHEAVNIAKKRGHQGIGSFVNGVLRNIDRKGLKDTDQLTDPIKKIGIETSHPVWLLERWVQYYGMATTKAICEENVTRKNIYMRYNPLKTNKAAILHKLSEHDIKAEASPWLEEALVIKEGNIFKTPLLEEGLLSIQDISSMLAAKSVEAKRGMNILDTCAAPGGKTAFLGEVMQNEGNIFAYDLHKNKVQLIQQQAKRLGITNIKANAQDARKLQANHEGENFDRILVDAPCSGFGVIRSKPDIKYQKTREDITHLQRVQQEILDHVAPLVKTGGKIVYSTCTIEKEENEWQVQAFLKRNKQFVVDQVFLHDMKLLGKGEVTAYGIQLFPQSLQSDGFFITRLIKQPE